MNKFEQVSSDGHQMSLEGQGYPHVSCLEGGSHVKRGTLYSEVLYITGNARQTRMKTLPSCNFVGGW